MAIAEGMREMVNDLKASRRSRHEFVKGNRQRAADLREENKRYMQTVREQNKVLIDQTHAFLKAAKDEHKASFKQTMDSIRKDIEVVHQSTQAIVQGARGLMKDFSQDSALARKYWMEKDNDEPIPDPHKAQKIDRGKNKVNVEESSQTSSTESQASTQSGASEREENTSPTKDSTQTGATPNPNSHEGASSANGDGV
jgi:hypothetical protein